LRKRVKESRKRGWAEEKIRSHTKEKTPKLNSTRKKKHPLREESAMRKGKRAFAIVNTGYSTIRETWGKKGKSIKKKRGMTSPAF